MLKQYGSADFLDRENISMIWDVISDEDIFKFLTKDIQSKISQIFFNNLQGFYNNEKNKSNLIEMNKKYIILMLNYIKNNNPSHINKIQIHEELSPTTQKELITYEEIQNDKKGQFERDLNKRQEEFTNAMSIKVPNVPDFSDKLKESPITEMEKMLKDMAAQRNYEVEQINMNFVKSQNDNWLTPQETSLKSEKLQPIQPIKQIDKGSTKLKYLIDTQDLSLNYQEQKKNVTWGVNETRELEKLDELEEIDNYNLLESNLFSKLKRIIQNKPIPTNTESKKNENNEDNEDRLNNLEEEMKEIKNKIDTVLSILQNR